MEKAKGAYFSHKEAEAKVLKWLGARIRSRMDELGISLSMLSRMTGIGLSTISEYLTGRYCPALPKIISLRNALDVDWAFFFERPGILGWGFTEEAIAAAWLFDEGEGNVLKDSSGNGNDGELIEGPEWVDGKFGKALKFDDGPDHVLIPDSPSLSPTSQISIVAWIYPIGGYQGPIGLIVYKDDWPGKARSYDLSIVGRSGNIRMHISHDAEGVNRCHRASTSNEIKLGEWNHVAGTFDGKEIRVYINGVKQENTDLWLTQGGSEEGPISDSETAVGIGRAIDKGDGYDFSGIIDEVAIFDVALTAEDINTIMALGLASTIAAVSPCG